ncbi:MAG: ComEC/Rec2 family competence protein [Nocardioidaceae bacterium]
MATGGILLLAPPWRDALTQWMPVALAEAIAVPLAAQVVCTPVVATISGQVSLVAVAANLLAAPAVGPTTVIGLVAGLFAVVSDTLGHVGGMVAGLPAWWIINVAHRAAALGGASMDWSATPLAIAGLTSLCAACVSG